MINIQLGDAINGVVPTIKSTLTNDRPITRLVGRTTKDYFMNKNITDPTNKVSASSVVVGSNNLTISPGGNPGDILTIIDANTVGFSTASGFATNTYVDNSISTHAALTTGTHGISGDIVGTTDSQSLTNKTIDTSNNSVTITSAPLVSTDINNLINQDLRLLSTPQFAGITAGKIAGNSSTPLIVRHPSTPLDFYTIINGNNMHGTMLLDVVTPLANSSPVAIITLPLDSIDPAKAAMILYPANIDTSSHIASGVYFIPYMVDGTTIHIYSGAIPPLANTQFLYRYVIMG